MTVHIFGMANVRNTGATDTIYLSFHAQIGQPAL
jgi:hypothetical protein